MLHVSTYQSGQFTWGENMAGDILGLFNALLQDVLVKHKLDYMTS